MLIPASTKPILRFGRSFNFFFKHTDVYRVFFGWPLFGLYQLLPWSNLFSCQKEVFECMHPFIWLKAMEIQLTLKGERQGFKLLILEKLRADSTNSLSLRIQWLSYFLILNCCFPTLADVSSRSHSLHHVPWITELIFVLAELLHCFSSWCRLMSNDLATRSQFHNLVCM